MFFCRLNVKLGAVADSPSCVTMTNVTPRMRWSHSTVALTTEENCESAWMKEDLVDSGEVVVEVVAMATVMAAVIEIGAGAARRVVGLDRADGAVGPARDPGPGQGRVVEVVGTGRTTADVAGHAVPLVAIAEDQETAPDLAAALEGSTGHHYNSFTYLPTYRLYGRSLESLKM